MKIWEFLKILTSKINEEKSLTGAAALAFYFTLATFPLIITLFAIIPYLPIDNLQLSLETFVINNLPEDASKIILSITKETVGTKKPVLLSTGFVLALWSASSGIMGIMEQINKVLGVKETRNYLRLRGKAIALTVVFGTMMLFSTSLVSLSSNLLVNFNLISQNNVIVVNIVKYSLSLLSMIFTFSLLYYYCPRASQRFRFVTPGGVLGALMFVGFVKAFNLYIESFSNYSKTYGSLGGMIIFMLWLYIVSFLILLGAQINRSIAILKEKKE